MKTRDLGQRSGFQVPGVNIGAMRLPQDLDDAIKLIRHAIDSGMRYIDTSRGYSESEWVLSHALKDGYREKVILSTKWSPWNIKVRPTDDMSAACERRRIEESMKRLDVDHLDYYQIWSINNREQYDEITAPGKMLDGILKAKKDGLIGHTGFTIHDSVENILKYVEEADWCEIILFSYNMLNRTYAPAIEAAHRKGIGTLVMNPVGGGVLGEASPVLLKLAKEIGAVSVPDLAVRYVLSNPNVDTIISGITKLSDVDDSIKSAERGAFTRDQMAKIEEFLESVSTEKTGFCTSCKYCMPCPNGVNIPEIMSCIHHDRYLGLQDTAREKYRGLKKRGLTGCNRCGKCEETCTQHLGIMAEIAYAEETYAEKETAPA